MKPKAPIDPKWEWHHQALVRIREKLIEERDEHAAEFRELRERGGNDDVDRANDKRDDDTLLAEIHLEDAELQEVEAALDRIRAGTYGFCEMTGLPIAPARLRAIPWTRLGQRAAESIGRKSAAG